MANMLIRNSRMGRERTGRRKTAIAPHTKEHGGGACLFTRIEAQKRTELKHQVQPRRTVLRLPGPPGVTTH